MTEQKEQGKTTKPLTLSTAARGAAAKADATQVKQKFSHGRTRQVTVELKKPVKRPAGAAGDASGGRSGARSRGTCHGPYPEAGAAPPLPLRPRALPRLPQRVAPSPRRPRVLPRPSTAAASC